MKSKSGITLIALVITVIVLLILAGVSISLVVGNNGVLTQASNAVIETRKAEAREDVEMAFASAEADYWSDWARNTNIPNLFEYYQEKLSSYLGITTDKIEEGTENADYKYKVDYGGYKFNIDASGKVTFDGEGTAVSTGGNENGSSTGGTTGGSGSESGIGEGPSITTYTVSFYANSGDTTEYDTKTVNSGESIGNSNMPTNPAKTNYTFVGWKKVSDDSEFTASTTIGEDTSVYAEWSASAAAVAAEPTTYYGKTVNYSANGITDWKIFYADSSNIFIIASDYIPKAKVPTNAKMTTAGTYQAYWDSIPTAQTVTTALASSFMFSHWTNYSSNTNGKCVSTMLNTGNGGGFVDTEVADYAIGGPTLEMYCASWNAKNSGNPMYWNTSSSNSNGYFLATAQNSISSYSVDMSSVGAASSGTGYYDTLYYPHREKYCSCTGYWLASPSARNSDSMVDISCAAEENASTCDYEKRSLRPLVRLKSGFTLTENTTTSGIDYDINGPQNGQ